MPEQISRIIGFFCIVLLASGAVGAGDGAREDFICTSGPSQRIVSVFNGRVFNGAEPNGGSCRVDYTRDGRTTTLWSSQKDPAYCTARAAELITKLVRGNYHCKSQATDKPG